MNKILSDLSDFLSIYFKVEFSFFEYGVEYGVFHIQKRKIEKNNIWLRSIERRKLDSVQIYTQYANYYTTSQKHQTAKKNGKKSPALKGCPQRRGTCARVYVRLVQIMNSNR